MSPHSPLPSRIKCDNNEEEELREGGCCWLVEEEEATWSLLLLLLLPVVRLFDLSKTEMKMFWICPKQFYIS